MSSRSVLIAKLSGSIALMEVVQATLERKVVSLQVETPPESSEEHDLEVHAPHVEWPLIVRAQPLEAGRFFLQPLDDFQEGDLLALLTAHQARADGERVAARSRPPLSSQQALRSEPQADRERVAAPSRPPPSSQPPPPAEPQAAGERAAPSRPAPSSQPPPPAEPLPTAPQTSDDGASQELIPIRHPTSGFRELFTAFTGAIVRTGYYEPGHPAYEHSLGSLREDTTVPLVGRREITFSRRSVKGAIELQVATGAGELHDLRELVQETLYEAYAPQMAEVFARRHLVSFTLKEGIDIDELGQVVELFAGAEMDVDELRDRLFNAALRHVSVLFEKDVITHASLPWHVRLCISRLARDLSGIPLMKDLLPAGRRKMQSRILADVIRPLSDATQVKLVFDNVHLINDAVAEAGQSVVVDLVGALVDAMAHPTCIRVAFVVLGELEAQASGGEGTEEARRVNRDLIRRIGERFSRDRTLSSDDVLRQLHSRAIVALDDLPEDFQMWVLAEQRLASLLEEPGHAFLVLDQLTTLDTYRYEVGILAAAMTLVARTGNVRVLGQIFTGMKQRAGDATPGESTKNALAAEALERLFVVETLLPIAEALFLGTVDVRDAARSILLSAGTAGAQALCRSRSKGVDERGARPRFVAVMTELGEDAVAMLATALDRASKREDAEYAEDLLRAVPDVMDEPLAEQVVPWLADNHPIIRKHAVLALASLRRKGAKPEIVLALKDDEEQVQSAAITALRRIACIDYEVAEQLGKIVCDDAFSSNELRTMAAAALGDSDADARLLAVEVLTHCIAPPPPSWVERMRGLLRPAPEEDPLLVETICRTLLSIGGDDGREAVKERAEHSRGDLFENLHAALEE